MRIFSWHTLLLLAMAGKGDVLVRAQDNAEVAEPSCRIADLYLDKETQTCLCVDETSSVVDEEENAVTIAGIFDTENFYWGSEVFKFTVDALNEGFFSTHNAGGLQIKYVLGEEACDERTALGSYWELRPVHGVVGGRCSGSTISMARLATLEQVPIVSPWATSAQLSDKSDFPFVSRVVGPDNANAQVGGIVSMLRLFGWDRVTVLNTDTQWAKDLVPEFQGMWTGPHDDATGKWNGTVAYSGTIRLNATDDRLIDEEAVKQTLQGIPPNDARVILLISYAEHAYPILEIAHEMDGFPKDTIWVDSASWLGREEVLLTDKLDWLPPNPGYLGLMYYYNRDETYQGFMTALREWQVANDLGPWNELPSMIVEYLVDSILVLVKGLVKTHGDSEPLRGNAQLISDNIRSQDFNGVSGRVQFTSSGDRKDPLFTIINLQNKNGKPELKEIGTTRAYLGSAEFFDAGIAAVCFAEFGCGLTKAPSDTYPRKVDLWVPILITLMMLLCVFVTVKYWRRGVSKRKLKAELESFKESVVGMRAVTQSYVPSTSAMKNIPVGVDSTMEGNVPESAPPPAHWCWQETKGYPMERWIDQEPEMIFGDKENCWIKYDDESNDRIEAAYQEQGKKGTFSPTENYVIDFDAMEQTKLATGFKRDVMRVVDARKRPSASVLKILRGSSLQTSDTSHSTRNSQFPSEDLKGEPQVVLVEGDIIQISKQRDDGWAFGSKLYHADEAVARDLQATATNGIDNDEALVLTDTGWFPLDTTRAPTAEDIEALKKNVNDTGALEPPSNWQKPVHKEEVQKYKLKQGDAEYEDVVKAFREKLLPAKATILRVDRIQNLAMYQSYVVKRQTVCYRETGLSSGTEVSASEKEAREKRALARFERRWLWHGTNVEVIDKILQQGFNRSFCGKNATVFGKGVYFARDSNYPATRGYAAPDNDGNQYVMACRVVVGEYCVGKRDALTPDLRNPKTHTLFDSTVGLLYNDNMTNPSIYVTYHDSQAYPEYLIKFKCNG